MTADRRIIITFIEKTKNVYKCSIQKGEGTVWNTTLYIRQKWIQYIIAVNL